MNRTSRLPEAAIDRRGTQRFRVDVPLTLIIEEREITAYTQDLSNRGVYFYIALAPGEMIGPDLEFVVELPPEITLSTCCRIRCRARLLRREKAAKNLSGIAAEILHYSILREAASIA